MSYCKKCPTKLTELDRFPKTKCHLSKQVKLVEVVLDVVSLNVGKRRDFVGDISDN